MVDDKPDLDAIIDDCTTLKWEDDGHRCTCFLGHPPCGFCELYPWDEDPLDILAK